MEVIGVELIAVFKALLMTATLLSAGLLVVLLIDRGANGRPTPALVLEPAVKLMQSPAMVGRPQRRAGGPLRSRAPPVTPRHLQMAQFDPCWVE